MRRTIALAVWRGGPVMLVRLYRVEPPSLTRGSRLHRALQSANVTADQLTALRWWLAGGLLVAGGFWVVEGVGIAGATAVMTLVVPLVVLVQRLGLWERSIVDDLPDFVDRIGRALRSGASFRQAMVEAHRTSTGPLRDAVQPVVDAVEAGRQFVTALDGLVVRIPRPEVRLVAAALALGADEAGAGRALDGVTQTLRERAALRDEVVGLAAQAVSSMYALVLLPAGFLGFDRLVGGHTMQFLFGEPVGQVCLLFGCGLNLIGWFWMRATIRRRFPT